MGSVVDPWHFGTDPNPRIRTKNMFFFFYFLKVHLHQSSKIKSHKEVTKQTVQIKVFLTYFARWWKDLDRDREVQNLRIREVQNLRIREVQNLRILWIRIRMHNTAKMVCWTRKCLCIRISWTKVCHKFLHLLHKFLWKKTAHK